MKNVSWRSIAWACVIAIMSSVMVACSNGKSYAELLTDENIATNSFLANHKVIPYEERDSTFNFEVGENAPFYQMDMDGNIYMQVLNAGTKGNYAEYDQLIYFRFTRYNLLYYVDDTLPDGEGNDADLSYGNSSFRFNNFSNYSSYQWGTGIQTALVYLPLDCQVKLVIKSQYGLYNEIANVCPYLYEIRYFKSQI